MLFITSYLAYRQTQKASTFYLTLFWALLGLYIKDIAIILFTIPPASLWISDAIQAKRTKKQNDILQTTNHDHCLEKWLCVLGLVFITSYIFLAFIPSSYAAKFTTEVPRALVLNFPVLLGSVLARTINILKHRLALSIPRHQSGRNYLRNHARNYIHI